MALYAVICRATGVRSAAQSHSTDAGLAQMAGNHSDTEQKGLAPKIRGGWVGGRAGRWAGVWVCEVGGQVGSMRLALPLGLAGLPSRSPGPDSPAGMAGSCTLLSRLAAADHDPDVLPWAPLLQLPSSSTSPCRPSCSWSCWWAATWSWQVGGWVGCTGAGPAQRPQRQETHVGESAWAGHSHPFS